MNKAIQKRLLFAGKSLLWSLLLYVAFMVASNWDEVSNGPKSRNGAPAVVTTTQWPQPTDNPAVFPSGVSKNTGIARGIITFIRNIHGIIKAPEAIFGGVN